MAVSCTRIPTFTHTSTYPTIHDTTQAWLTLRVAEGLRLRQHLPVVGAALHLGQHEVGGPVHDAQDLHKSRGCNADVC